MKKILAALVFTLLAVTLRAQGGVLVFPIYNLFFVPDGTDFGTGELSGVKYEDGSLLAVNESIRVLAVWSTNTVSEGELPFSMNVLGEPVIENGFCMWLETTTFAKENQLQTQIYAPVLFEETGAPGAALLSNEDLTLYGAKFALNNVSSVLPETYQGEDFSVYLITRDTRLGEVVPTESPALLQKWNAVLIATEAYGLSTEKNIAVNFSGGLFTSIMDQGDTTPILSPTSIAVSNISSVDTEILGDILGLDNPTQEDIDAALSPQILRESQGLTLTEDELASIDSALTDEQRSEINVILEGQASQFQTLTIGQTPGLLTYTLMTKEDLSDDNWTTFDSILTDDVRTAILNEMYADVEATKKLSDEQQANLKKILAEKIGKGYTCLRLYEVNKDELSIVIPWIPNQNMRFYKLIAD